MRDVERARSAAARRRMTAQELAIWRALVDTTAELRRILGARLLQESSLSPADYQVLLALSEATAGGCDHRSSRRASIGSEAGCPITSGGWSGAV